MNVIRKFQYFLADTNRNKNQAKTSISVNFDKVIDNDASSSNKKRSYDLYHNSIPGSSKKRSYEELFGDISDLLETNVSGIACNEKLQYDYSLNIIRILGNFNFF